MPFQKSAIFSPVSVFILVVLWSCDHSWKEEAEGGTRQGQELAYGNTAVLCFLGSDGP
jgi:hypothetical protein